MWVVNLFVHGIHVGLVDQLTARTFRVARPDVRKGVANGFGAFLHLSRARHSHPVGLGVPPTLAKLTHHPFCQPLDGPPRSQAIIATWQTLVGLHMT